MIHLCAFAMALYETQCIADDAVVAAIDCECCFEIIFIPPNMSCVGIPWQFAFANVYKTQNGKKNLNWSNFQACQEIWRKKIL